MSNIDSGKLLENVPIAGDDHVVPFQVEGLDIRGRSVQMGPMLDAILSRHTYPTPVAQLLAEAITLTVLLGTSLKFNGRLILQTKGDGPVDLLVADFQAPHSVRGYAQFDEDKVEAAVKAGQGLPHQMLGKGVLAFTIDQGAHMQRYQGIVEMKGETLSEMAESYFRQSEQIPTKISLGVAELVKKFDDGKSGHEWRAGGMLVQFLPHASDRNVHQDLPGGDDPNDPEGHNQTALVEDDAWVEAKTMVETISVDELTDPQVGSETLLYRLFHERGVRLYDAVPVRDECSCSREKLFNVLSQMDQADLRQNIVDGVIGVTCEFCSTQHVFDPKEFILGPSANN